MFLYRFQWKKIIKWVLIGVLLFLVYSFCRKILKANQSEDGLEVLTLNEKKVPCSLPELPLWVNEQQKNDMLAHTAKVDCSSNQKDWSYIQNGKFYIHDDVEKQHGKLSCQYQNVLRQLYDMEITLSKSESITNNTPIPSDIIHVRCVGADGQTNDKTYLGIKPIPQEPTSKLLENRLKLEGLGLNIIMFGFDTVSRLMWKRYMPNSYSYFEKIGGVVMEHYNILGDGTPQALIPILTGNTEIELPEARRGFKKARHVDGHPWIWKKLHEYGYATQWGEDAPSVGTFTHRMLGFKEKPVHHYMRPFFLKQGDGICFGNRPSHTLFTDYLKEFITAYGPLRRKFSFLFHSSYSHNSQDQLSTPDDDLVSLMDWLNSTNELENSLFILMADHGPRFSSTRATEQGKYEERLPFMGVRVPQTEEFRSNFPLVQENLKRNSKLLTTPFDVHATFQDVLNYRSTHITKRRPYQRGYSLLQRVPADRTCNDASIDAHWCTCLRWYKISVSDELVQRGAGLIVDHVNNLTSPFRDMCALLTPHKLTSATFIQSNGEMLKFRESSDSDGRIPDMTDQMQPTVKIFQIVLSTLPNFAVYEATIKYSLKNDDFTISTSDISRLNAYKDQPKCITEMHPHLRPYCYCF
ncbi:hypothetical protein HELRODRAFT_88302 [Helobdella robusta]|uniref:Uncharacterized protein n=1 Tax=Helobdella robusta TaxID=6412 RepID=T1G713_HELRO|nr:hypothetical protein HELRODRAFT_88302 [Helobdella robusta]ESN93700.1 hypothetical protein HELRODRAFT_88302 [Helobdella robusta]